MMREREREMWFEVEEKKVGGCAVGREREERERKKGKGNLARSLAREEKKERKKKRRGGGEVAVYVVVQGREKPSSLVMIKVVSE